MALADAREELAQLADAGGGRRRRLLGRDRRLEGDADECQLPVPKAALCGIEPEHLGKHDGEGRPMRQPAARAERVPQRVNEADARATCLPHPGQMRRHEHLRARSRSDPSAIARGSHSWTVRITPTAIDSANGLPFRDSSDSSEWVIASTPVAAVTPGGSPTVSSGSRIVVTGRSEGWPM